METTYNLQMKPGLAWCYVVGGVLCCLLILFLWGSSDIKDLHEMIFYMGVGGTFLLIKGISQLNKPKVYAEITPEGVYSPIEDIFISWDESERSHIEVDGSDEVTNYIIIFRANYGASFQVNITELGIKPRECAERINAIAEREVIDISVLDFSW